MSGRGAGPLRRIAVLGGGVAAYCLAHYGLSPAAELLEVGRNVSVWFLPAGVLMASLLPVPRSWLGAVVLGDLLARAYWSFDYPPVHFVFGLLVPPGVYLGVACLLRARGVGAGGESAGQTWTVSTCSNIFGSIVRRSR